MTDEESETALNFSGRLLVDFVFLAHGVFKRPIFVDFDGRAMNAASHGDDHVKGARVNAVQTFRDHSISGNSLAVEQFDRMLGHFGPRMGAC